MTQHLPCGRLNKIISKHGLLYCIVILKSHIISLFHFKR
jgi:hypothetical protein